MKTMLVALSLCLSMCVCLAVAAAADGKELYAKCQGCHGADGAKTPMGVGKPLKGMSEADAAKALAGYKTATYGGEKKAIMESQAKGLSDEDMKALAKYISTL
ncbi:MAG: c-type cytochrome [Desulfovibrionaceae bacterium]|nr:c-type cytochrome [Desulfovibrionaceae bacterium]